MPKRSIVGVRELNRLKSTSGTGGRYRGVDKIPWCFDNVTSIGREALITPSNPSSLVIQAVTDPWSNECNVPVPDDDSESGTTSSEETDDSYLSDDSNVSDTPHQGGNRIINLPNLLLSLNDIVTCKHCCVSDLDDFVRFCELKWHNAVNESEGRGVRSRHEYLKSAVNVKRWRNEWQKAKEACQSFSIHDVNHGLATELNLSCTRCNKKWTMQQPEKTKLEQVHNEVCKYEINLRFALALQLLGVGGEHAATVSAFLDLPDAHKWRRDFNVLESYMHDASEEVKNKSQDVALSQEVCATINLPEGPVPQSLLDNEVPLHRIQGCYDMGWQVRSSGNKYGSSTGHALMVGALTKKVVDSVVFNKKCALCTKTHRETHRERKHRCVKNYEGSSKSMEAAGLVKILTRMQERGVSVCTIISDDDSNARAKAQHIRNGGQLTDNIEEPKFLADPSHRKRVFARAIYNLASAPVKVSRVSKGLAGHLKYCYGACVKRYRHLTVEELSQKVYNILEHICDNHDNCDESWCYDAKAKALGKQYKAPPEHRIKKDDTVTYQQLKKIFDQYANLEQMGYCNHPYDTQTNESLNQAIATLAPKNTCYSGTISLYSRIALVIGIHNLGHVEHFNVLFETLGMAMTHNLMVYLDGKQRKKQKKQEYQRRLDVKVRRSQTQKKSREEVFKERTDNSYGTGVGLTAGIKANSNRKTVDSNGKNKEKGQCKCGSTSHSRTTHTDCPLNKKRKLNETGNSENETQDIVNLP